MLVFQNFIFTMREPQNSWHLLGYETIQNDGRKIIIEPVQKRSNENNTISIQMNASIKLNSNPAIINEIVQFPSDEMKALVNSLRYYSHLISVAEVDSVSISSPFHSRGFIPETSQEKDYLDTSKGFESRMDIHMVMKDNFFQAIFNDQLLDRQDGVRLMSSINSINNPLARFKELIRLFENAFGTSSNELASLLENFLQTAPSARYDSQEVRLWIVSNRDAATHADLRRTPFLIHDEHVQDDIDRILQAGYDVLLNKEKWHDRSISRRQLSTPASVINPSGLTIHKNIIANFGFDISSTDRPFYALRKNESELLSQNFIPPSSWWHKTVQKNN